MLSAAGNDYKPKKGEGLDQVPFAYETDFGAIQSKKKAVRRINFQDTDNNKEDTEAIDYSGTSVSRYLPHSTAYGAWDEYSMMLNEISDAKKAIPKFYDKYCTEESVGEVISAVLSLDEALSNDVRDIEELDALKKKVEEAVSGLEFRHDEKVAQIYIATDKGNGESYGTSLVKAIGYVPAQIVCVSSDGSRMAYDMGAQVKVHGNATAGGRKRPYNLKFSDGVDLFGFGKYKKWVLLADMYDPSLMRNYIALTLGKELGLEATTDCNRVEVWVDGQYSGLYLLTEKIEDGKNRVDIDVKNGDFLLEMDLPSRTEAGNIYLTTASGRYYRLREPEEADKVESIRAVMNQLENTAKSGDWEKIKECFDIDSFVSYYILNEFMKSIDFHVLSVYFYYHDGKFYAGPAWDYDNSSGNYYLTYSGHPIHSSQGLYAAILCHYYKYLYKFPEFQSAIFKKFLETDKDGLIENVYKEGGLIDKDVEFYSEAIERNYSTWNFVCFNRTPDSTYEGNINYLKNWLQARHNFMRSYFLNRIYEEEDGRYYYVNGLRTPAGLITYDNNYYYAGEDGKIATDQFTIDGHTYYTDNSGKILLQSLSIDITGPDSLTLNYGTSSSLTLTASITGHYGYSLANSLPSSAYSLTWSADIQAPGLAFSGGTLTAQPELPAGTHSVPVRVIASSSGVQSMAQKVITITVKDIAPELDTVNASVRARTGEEIAPVIITALHGTNIAWNLAGTLPEGISGTISGDSFIISGTAGRGSSGTHSCTLTASNTEGESSASIEITIAGHSGAYSGTSGDITAFTNTVGDFLMSADIAVIPESEDFTGIEGEELTFGVSVDVLLVIADTFYDEYYYSMDIIGLPEWLKASGELASSDMLIPIDSEGRAEYHHALTLSGTPEASHDAQTARFIVSVKVSGDTPILEAYASKDINISVNPAPLPEESEPISLDIEPSPDIEPESSPDVIPEPSPDIVPEASPDIIIPEPSQDIEPLQQEPSHDIVPVQSPDIVPEPVRSPDIKPEPVQTPEISHVPQPALIPQDNGSFTVNNSVNISETIDTMTEEQIQEVTKLEISGNISDVSFIAKLTNLQEVDLKNAEKLEALDMSGNASVKSIDISGNKSVKAINLTGSKIETLYAQDCANLEVLNASSCRLTSINLNGCISLTELNLNGNSLAVFDAQAFSNLRELSCSGQVIEGWTSGKTFSFGTYINNASVSSAGEVNSAFANISGVKAYDEDGEEITAEYDSTTGTANFGSVPYKFTYEYITGFKDIAMDVAVFVDGEENDEGIAELGEPGGGCNTGFAFVMLVFCGVILFCQRWNDEQHKKLLHNCPYRSREIYIGRQAFRGNRHNIITGHEGADTGFTDA